MDDSDSDGDMEDESSQVKSKGASKKDVKKSKGASRQNQEDSD